MIARLAMSDFLQALQAFCGKEAKKCVSSHTMKGWEAQIVLQFLLDRGGVFEDPAVDYLASRVDEMDAAALLEAMHLLQKRLGELESEEGEASGERLRITRDYRILLPDRFDAEIRLRPLVKTVFLLFLRHPEGIRFRDLSAYKDEMTALYKGITRRSDPGQLEESIGRLIDPRDNSIHEKASNLASALSRYFPPETLSRYILTGKAGTPKRIRLDRSRVEWE